MVDVKFFFFFELHLWSRFWFFSSVEKAVFFPVKSITFSTTDLHNAGVLPV